MRKRLIGIGIVCILISVGFVNFFTNEAKGANYHSVWDNGNIDDILQYMADHYDMSTDSYSFPYSDDMRKAQEIIDSAKEVELIRDNHKDDNLLSASLSKVSEVLDNVLSSDKFGGIDYPTKMLTILKDIKIIDGNTLNRYAHKIANFANTLRELKNIEITKITETYKLMQYIETQQYTMVFEFELSKTTIYGEFKGGISSITLILNFWKIADSWYKHENIKKNIKDEMNSDVNKNGITIIPKVGQYEIGLENQRFIYDIGKTIASMVGGLIGQQKGVAIGAAVGAYIGGHALGIGAFPGALIGATIGYLGGGKIGSALVEEACDMIYYNLLDTPLYEKIRNFGMRIELISAKILNIYSEGNDFYVSSKEKLYVNIKNTGVKEQEFIVSPFESYWSLSDSWNPWPSPEREAWDLDNSKKIKLKPGKTGNVWFAVNPDKSYSESNIGFTLWFDDNGIWFGGKHYLDTMQKTFYSLRLPVFDIIATSSKGFGDLGEKYEVTIITTNVGTAIGTFKLGVSFKHILDDDSNSIDATSITPSGFITLGINQTKDFIAEVKIPTNAKRGQYQIAVNCWEKPYTKQYRDNLEWKNIFYVGDSSLSITSPTESSPAKVGSSMSPLPTFLSTIEVKESTTNKPIVGLTKNNFKVYVGNKETQFMVSFQNDINQYKFSIKPPTQSSAGEYDLKIELVQSGIVVKSATNQRAVSYSSGKISNVDVVLVIDRSGSMGTEKMESAKDSGKQFVVLMNYNDMVGIVDFDNKVTVTYPLTLITSDDNIKRDAQNAIDTLYARGGTSIGGGLEEGKNQLITRGRIGQTWAIVLMSDGLENTAPRVADVLPTVIANNIKVFTIGFGSGADEYLLGEIASQTGGIYIFVPSSSNASLDLQRVYNEIGGVVRGESTIYSKKQTINPNEVQWHSIYIDSSVGTATFGSIVGGSELDFSIINPYGLIINETTALLDPNNITFISSGTYKGYKISNITFGMWYMNVVGKDVSYNEEYFVSVIAETYLTLTAETNKQRYNYSEPIQIFASVMDPSSIVFSMSVIANITDPYSNNYEVQLYDDGAHGDGDAKDGLFSNYFTETTTSGSYTIDIIASGITPTGDSFTREQKQSVSVSSDSIPSTITISPTELSIEIKEGEKTTKNVNFASSSYTIGALSITNLQSFNGTISSSEIKLSRNMMAIEPSKTENITLTINVPYGTPAGVYKGNIIFSSKDTIQIPISVEVKESDKKPIQKEIFPQVEGIQNNYQPSVLFTEKEKTDSIDYSSSLLLLVSVALIILIIIGALLSILLIGFIRKKR